jgi:hypothetical protein
LTGFTGTNINNYRYIYIIIFIFAAVEGAMLFFGWGSIRSCALKLIQTGLIILPVILGLAFSHQTVHAAQGESDQAPKSGPALRFHVEDTGVCLPEPTWIKATVTVSLPENMTARLQVSYHIVQPKRTEIVYAHPAIVKDGDTYTFSSYWPGIQPGDRAVEIHWGAALLDVKTGRVLATAGLDYFWYPYICEPHGPTATPIITVTPIPTATSMPTGITTPTRSPDKKQPRATTTAIVPPDWSSRLPTLAPPTNPEDRYAVLPETGDDRRAGAMIQLIVYLGLLGIGGRLVFRPLRKFLS